MSKSLYLIGTGNFRKEGTTGTDPFSLYTFFNKNTYKLLSRFLDIVYTSHPPSQSQNLNLSDYPIVDS